MEHRLASREDQLRRAWVKRFTPRLWTVDFARPMMAALTIPTPRTLRVDLDFLTRGDLAGLIWASEDGWSHPLLAYRTDRDYRMMRLAFDWVSGAGVMPLDRVHGPTLTIEGRDAGGAARTWYVRLWNYADGSPNEARILLDFDDLRSGFEAGGEQVFTGDVDRMFISIVPGEYDGSAVALAAPRETHVELRDIVASGARSTISMGDPFQPEHRLRMCSGYDDSYHQPPERLIEQWRALGYRGIVNHYVGMSHYFALRDVGAGRFEVGDGLCASASSWHRALLRAAAAAGYDLIFSLSFELFDAHAPEAWAQKDVAGRRALTGWAPPSTLLSPCNQQAMDWLCTIAQAFAGLMVEETGRCAFQVGEPWWWVGADGAPCFFDAATVAAWTSERGSPPPAMSDVAGARPAQERVFLDWLGTRLAQATFQVRDAARAMAPGDFQSLLLFFAPQVLDHEKPELHRANMPTAWSWPAWDVLQLEDYDFVVAGDEAGRQRGREAVSLQLGYPQEAQHYLSGFVLQAADAEVQWRRIGDAAADTLLTDVSEVLVWAWPQIARDGFQWIEIQQEEEAAMEAFHDVRFPLELGFDAVGGPEFSTQVAMLASGHEQRNVQWAQARLSYDASIGVRSESDLVTLLHFFRARRGQGFGFRFRDPLDWMSCGPDATISARDQVLGYGDGARLIFSLVKRYGEEGAEEIRRISRPVSDSVVVAVDGQSRGWMLLPGGRIQFEQPPAQGAQVSAGFAFDVPVRFATDRIDISLSRWKAGELPAVPVVEIRE